MAYASPWLLATECYLNCLAERWLLHVDRHCESSSRAVFHVKTISSTVNHHLGSFSSPCVLQIIFSCSAIGSDCFFSPECACMHTRVCVCPQCHTVMVREGGWEAYSLCSRSSFFLKRIATPAVLFTKRLF